MPFNPTIDGIDDWIAPPTPGKLADGTDDPNDWIDPAHDDGLPDDWIAAAPQANPNAGGSAAGGWPGAGSSMSLAPPAPDPFTAYWSKYPTSQFGGLTSAPLAFPNSPGFQFGTPSTTWPPAPQPIIPSGGILESLRDLGTQPGQVPYAGILEGLRYLGAPPDQGSAWSNGAAFNSSPGFGLPGNPADRWRQPLFASQTTTNTPTAAPNGRPPIGDYSAGEIAGDTAKSFGVGAGRGVLGLLGLPGDVREAIAGGLQKTVDYLAPGYAPNIGAQTSDFLASNPLVRAWNPLFAGPTSAQLQNAAEQVTGPFYQPKTIAGDYAQTIGEFLPGALLMPEGSLAARALRYGLVPALSSETAGQLTQGTAAEPWARFGGAVVGGPGTSWRDLPLGPAGRLLRNTGSGQIAEDIVGIPRNASKPTIVITDSGKVRYPDRLTPETIEEVKNRGYQAFTAQIRDYLAYAEENGIKFILHVRPGIRYSAPLRALIDAGRITERPIRGLPR